jgi:FMN phosphatase YigB (HAD superfamily)
MSRALDVVDGVLFDIGSTLVMGPDVSPAKELARAFGVEGERAAALTRLIMCHDFGEPDEVCLAIERVGFEVDLVRRQFVTDLWRAQERAASPIAGAASAVEAFVAAGKRVGLLSDIWAPYYRAVETVLPGVVSRVEPILSFRCAMKKPDAAFFAAAVDRLGLPPARILMVGDSYHSDIAPAMAAGMKTAWVLTRPDREIGSLLDVLNGRRPRPDWTLATTEDVAR